MEKPIINILTFQLPFELANQIYKEYHDRFREVIFFLDNTQKFRKLKDNIKTIELLLALSIFHKRVISNLDAAIKFYGRVSDYSQATVIKIGNYNFTGDERNKLLGVVISYNKLIEKFGIPAHFVNYYFTKEFLQKMLDLLNFKYANDEEKNQENSNNSTFDLEDLPF